MVGRLAKCDAKSLKYPGRRK